MMISYKFALGDFETEGGDNGPFGVENLWMCWILFILNTLFLLVILLNMLIAIMGDTFNRVQESMEEQIL